MKKRERFIVAALFVVGAVLCVSAAATGLGLFEAEATASSKATPLGEYEEKSTGAQILVDGMTPPKLKEKVQPVYPKELREARIDGKVILQAVIDEEGRVDAVEILRSSKQMALDNAAIDAVRQWRYEPASKDGKPVKVFFTVVVNFDIQGAPNPV